MLGTVALRADTSRIFAISRCNNRNDARTNVRAASFLLNAAILCLRRAVREPTVCGAVSSPHIDIVNRVRAIVAICTNAVVSFRAQVDEVVGGIARVGAILCLRASPTRTGQLGLIQVRGSRAVRQCDQQHHDHTEFPNTESSHNEMPFRYERQCSLDRGLRPSDK